MWSHINYKAHIIIVILKFGWKSEIWLNSWNLPGIMKFAWNHEMGLKFCNLIQILKFVEDDEEDLQLLNYHEKL